MGNSLNIGGGIYLTRDSPVSSSVVRDPVLRVASLYHASVVEGPGRRSVLQVQGCPLRCSLVIYSAGAANLWG